MATMTHDPDPCPICGEDRWNPARHTCPSPLEMAARAARERGEDELAAMFAVAPPEAIAKAFRILAEQLRNPG